MKIHEIVATFQGEGKHAGLPVILVRVQGCNGRCPWCDTPRALDASDVGVVLRPQEVLEHCHDAWVDARWRESPWGRRNILLTGGEPGIVGAEELDDFYELAHNHGWNVHVESNGTQRLYTENRPYWICISPKPAYTPGLDPIMIHEADEIKWVYEGMGAGDCLQELLRTYLVDRQKVCIQPLWSDKEMQNIAIDYALEQGFRVSLQMHKFAERR